MISNVAKLLLLFTVLLFVESAQDKCHILSLEGGGDKGAYQAGAIWGLVNGTDDTQWDVVSGISVGAINGAGMAIFAKGQEKNASQFMIDLWRGLSGYGSIYKSWKPFGVLQGLFEETGVYSTEPLKDLLTTLVANATLQREFVIGATNIKTGDYDVFFSKDLAREDYVQAVLSSSAFPFVFPNIQFKNNSYMDGGVKYSVDVPSAIQKCRDLGFEDNNIVVDVVLCSQKIIKQIDPERYRTYDVLLRTVQIFLYDMSMRDLTEIGHIFPNVTLRYVVAPSKELPSGAIPLDFKPKEIDEMVNIGINDGINAVKAGEGVTFGQLRKKYIMEKASLFLNKKDITLEEAEEMMKKIRDGKQREYERLKQKFLGKKN